MTTFEKFLYKFGVARRYSSDFTSDCPFQYAIYRRSQARRRTSFNNFHPGLCAGQFVPEPGKYIIWAYKRDMVEVHDVSIESLEQCEYIKVPRRPNISTINENNWTRGAWYKTFKHNNEYYVWRII